MLIIKYIQYLNIKDIKLKGLIISYFDLINQKHLNY